jgi:hypothetical protein
MSENRNLVQHQPEVLVPGHSLCFMFAAGICGIICFPIFLAGSISAFILMSLSFFAYFVKCFQSSKRSFAYLQMLFGSIFACEMLTEIAVMIHSSNFTEGVGLWIFRGRIVLLVYSSLVGMFVSWYYVKENVKENARNEDAEHFNSSMNRSFFLQENGFIFLLVSSAFYHLKSFIYGLISIFKWHNTISRDEFVNLYTLMPYEKDEANLVEQKVVMFTDFVLFVFPNVLLSIVEIILVKNESSDILYISFILAFFSIMHFSQFYAIQSGNFVLGDSISRAKY